MVRPGTEENGPKLPRWPRRTGPPAKADETDRGRDVQERFDRAYAGSAWPRPGRFYRRGPRSFQGLCLNRYVDPGLDSKKEEKGGFLSKLASGRAATPTQDSKKVRATASTFATTGRPVHRPGAVERRGGPLRHRPQESSTCSLRTVAVIRLPRQRQRRQCAAGRERCDAGADRLRFSVCVRSRLWLGCPGLANRPVRPGATNTPTMPAGPSPRPPARAAGLAPTARSRPRRPPPSRLAADRRSPALCPWGTRDQNPIRCPDARELVQYVLSDGAATAARGADRLPVKPPPTSTGARWFARLVPRCNQRPPGPNPGLSGVAQTSCHAPWPPGKRGSGGVYSPKSRPPGQAWWRWHLSGETTVRAGPCGPWRRPGLVTSWINVAQETGFMTMDSGLILLLQTLILFRFRLAAVRGNGLRLVLRVSIGKRIGRGGGRSKLGRGANAGKWTKAGPEARTAVAAADYFAGAAGGSRGSRSGGGSSGSTSHAGHAGHTNHTAHAGYTSLDRRGWRLPCRPLPAGAAGQNGGGGAGREPERQPNPALPSTASGNGQTTRAATRIDLFIGNFPYR